MSNINLYQRKSLKKRVQMTINNFDTRSIYRHIIPQKSPVHLDLLRVSFALIFYAFRRYLTRNAYATQFDVFFRF